MKIERKHFAKLDSTNTWAKENVHAFSRDCITLVIADEQTAGRGRFHRHWHSPPCENIYATFCFFVDPAFPFITNIPQVLAVSTAKVLESLQFIPKLKWPNDILISGKKVSGILCETQSIEDRTCIFLGIGLNVNMPFENLQKINRPATSLFAEGGQKLKVEEVIQNLQNNFCIDLSLLIGNGFSSFYPEYIQRLMHCRGDSICFHHKGKAWDGTFNSINPDGSLNAVDASGRTHNFVSGELS